MAWSSALTVMVTGTERVVFPALTLTVPVKVPGPRRAGSAVKVKMAGEPGVAFPVVWESVSGLAPDGVTRFAVAEKFSVPPPELEIVRLWLWAGVDFANEKVKLRGS